MNEVKFQQYIQSGDVCLHKIGTFKNLNYKTFEYYLQFIVQVKLGNAAYFYTIMNASAKFKNWLVHLTFAYVMYHKTAVCRLKFDIIYMAF